MNCSRIEYSGHAVRQMFARRISIAEVEAVITGGRVIADYPGDTPFPSRLILGTVEGRAIHAVVAQDESDNSCIIVTVYEPDPALWSDDFSKRRNP